MTAVIPPRKTGYFVTRYVHLYMLIKWDSISEVAQSCPTLCNPMDCSLPGFSIHGILQARILECVTISFSRGSSPPRDWTRVSHIAGRRFDLWATRYTLTQWQALSEFRYSHYSPNFNCSCIAVLITAIPILVVAYYLYIDFLFSKLNLFFKETSKKWKTNIIGHKKKMYLEK